MTETPRFQNITETTGGALTGEAADMMYTRYALAVAVAAGRRVLELGCGAGLGLGLVSRESRFTVGGDYSATLLRSGRSHYGSRVPFVRLSAEALPFPASTFDLVLFFEASYYIPDMELAFTEIPRVLAPGGTVLFVNANPERPGFIPSPHSVRYHTADEFRAALEGLRFRVTVEGAFPVDPPETGLATRLKETAVGLVRQVLQALHLVPRTLRGRARLKRLVYGKLRRVPPELPEGFAKEVPRVSVLPGPVRGYKVLYVTASREV